MTAAAEIASPFRQLKAVWAVVFACVISFMGIGPVDPILPSLAGRLEAGPSQVELLITSGSIGEIVSYRPGWGLGNALFIATSLAAIVGSATYGFVRFIGGGPVLYAAGTPAAHDRQKP
jgi:hypothetical protein